MNGSFGALPIDDGGFLFSVWAPKRERVDVILTGGDAAGRTLRLSRDDHGFHSGVLTDARPGDRYLYRLDRRLQRPDPASRAQPHGVHEPSMLVDPAFDWTDHGWSGRPLEEAVLYELHVGTFTSEGSFTAVVDQLDALVDLGVTAVELMPVAQFPGHRNWGYDGVYPYATQWSYGGLRGLQQLVDACHRQELAVVLDVVYNHLGPEGCYFADFGPFFTDHYRTPWGSALNFDGPDSVEVRRFFVENALWWLEAAHVDGFRLDAVHAIIDSSAYPFVEELSDAVHQRAAELDRRAWVIAEDAHNDSRLSRAKEAGGMGLDAQWNDDLHHALHVALTGEHQGYYRDFTGVTEVAAVLDHGFAYAGRISAERRRRVGRPEGADPARTVAFLQNHDQVGNRAQGERIDALADAEAQKAAAALVLLGPWIPLIFQGEEHREEAPFLYFVDHGDPELMAAVRRGRQAEFRSFGWADVADPGDETTFLRSTIDHVLATKQGHTEVRELYRVALRLRRDWRDRWGAAGHPSDVLRRGESLAFGLHDDRVLVVAHLGGAAKVSVPLDDAGWQLVLDSTAPRFGGPGPVPPPAGGAATVDLPGPACLVFERTEEAL